ncbi:MAG: hypothetical protein KF746_03525 [Chitinophagaceae bacterium]|nr:hypothetical protein [Chitinophagaceae bacterium]
MRKKRMSTSTRLDAGLRLKIEVARNETTSIMEILSPGLNICLRTSRMASAAARITSGRVILIIIPDSLNGTIMKDSTTNNLPGA